MMSLLHFGITSETNLARMTKLLNVLIIWSAVELYAMNWLCFCKANWSGRYNCIQLNDWSVTCIDRERKILTQQPGLHQPDCLPRPSAPDGWPGAGRPGRKGIGPSRGIDCLLSLYRGRGGPLAWAATGPATCALCSWLTFDHVDWIQGEILVKSITRA